jgi:beta-glucosidase
MNTMLRRIAWLATVGLTYVALGLGGSFPAAKLKAIDKKVDALLKKMTLDEKVGQMTQVTIDVVSKGEDGRLEPHELDPVKLENAIVRYHVGSILNVGPSFYSVSHWIDVITRIQDVATKQTHLGIPILYGIDAVHGANYTKEATLFPQSFAVAAAWDPEIAKRIGQITAYEVRASGIPWNFHPVLDLGRQPLWPRFWETYGEDVLLARTLGTSYISGLMGDDMSAKDKVASCLKHYAGYSFPISGKDRTPAWIDERMMREYFLPSFEAGVKAGAPTVMVNSSEINGIPGHANYHLLTEVLKQEWEFDGFIVSDWQDIERLYTRDHVAESPKEAVRIAVMAGIDMSMVPLDFSFYDLLLQLVEERSVPVSRIDDAVRRILRVKFLVGLFEKPYPDTSLQAGFASKEFTEFNQRVARDVITLLKNSRAILPLKKGTRVLVTGPTANLLSVLNSGWTITWQGDNEALYPKDKPTILGAIQSKLGVKNVAYAPGTSFDTPINIAAAVAAAETADVVIACLGEKAYCETPGNIDELTLDEAQLRLVEEVAKKGKPIVLVLAEGRPRIIHRIVDKCQAIVMAYLPGMEGGTATADILFGDAVPGGKLPFSYPKFPNALLAYDHKSLDAADGNTYDPEFPFGFGLSYTTFEYFDLKLSKDVFSMNDDITLSVSVKNTGGLAGLEVVQVYVSDLYRSISPPVKELKAFKKVALQPGESRTVNFTLKSGDLSFIGKDCKRIVEPGRFKIAIAKLSSTFEIR